MSAPTPPSLVDLGKLIGDNVHVMQWLEALHAAVALAIAQEAAAVTGQSQMDDAKARVVAWRALDTLGRYVRDVPTDPPTGSDPEPGTGSDTFD